jgi:hypothetical protein
MIENILTMFTNFIYPLIDVHIFTYILSEMGICNCNPHFRNVSDMIIDCGSAD